MDCGAYFGYFKIFVSKKVGKTGKVLAFEPDPRNLKILRENVASAKINNIIVIEKALSNKNSKLRLKSKFWLSSVSEDEKDDDKNIEVYCTTLDNIIKRIGISKVDFIKMDIEGAELEVLEGSKKTLQNTSHIAIACYHKRKGKKTGEILETYMKQMGFDAKISFFLHPTLYGSKL